jgi:hypothetical protein
MSFLAGLDRWAREVDLKLRVVDTSGADQDELETLVPLLRDFSREWSVYTVVFVPSEEGGDG